jgi:hypothetical protein
MKKNDEREIRNACVAVKRGVRVRRNCNVFNLAMENKFVLGVDVSSDWLWCPLYAKLCLSR